MIAAGGGHGFELASGASHKRNASIIVACGKGFGNGCANALTGTGYNNRHNNGITVMRKHAWPSHPAGTAA
jgi:hypothetical protein